MSRSVKLSHVYGENVTIDKHSVEAKWAPERSGGWIYSSMPMEAGQKIHVTLDGSGHCDVGVIKKNPKECDMCSMPSLFKKLNGIQIHRMNCRIPISLNRDGNEVKSEYNGDVYKKNVNKKVSVWIAVYVKFGDISTQLVDETTGRLYRLSENHGTNIRLDDSRKSASTINSNPAALCFVGTRLQPGETLHLVCEPIQEGNRKSRRFHIKLLTSRNNPENFLRDFKSAFDTSLVPVSDPPLTVLEILEKEECDGVLSISLNKSLQMKYVSATQKQNKQILNFDASSGVWLGFELFRVSVKLKSCIAMKEQCQNEVDSRLREPRNDNAENSMEPFISFVDHLNNRPREAEYLSSDGTASITCRESYLKEKIEQPQSLAAYITRNDLGKVQNNTVRPKSHVQKVQKDMKQVDKGSNQRPGEENKVFNKPSPSEDTVPKSTCIPRPIQIPIPTKLETDNGSKTGKSNQPSIQPSSSHDKNHDRLPMAELSTALKPANNESAIVSHLSRIEKMLINLQVPSGTQHYEPITNELLPRLTNDSGDIAPAKNEPIQKNWVFLVENICADKLCDHLYQEGYIRDDERQLTTEMYKTDPQSANRQLLQLIKKRKIPTHVLVKIFEAAEQSHLTGTLTQ